MKDNLLKFLKIFLIAALIILGLLLVVAIVLAMRWPLWMVFFLLLLIGGLVIGGFFLRNLYKRRNEQQFVGEIVAQDDAQNATLSPKERDDRKQLQENWKASIDVLRNSHLKKMGNPLYVLPWYLMIGESGSGKTTSLNSARLASPFPEFARTSGISGTRNCDWWFLEQAIIIDTAGRYSIPVNGEPDRQEWQKFLSLLVQYRKKEPLNGLIVTIAADKLLESQPSVIEEEARTMRRRVDELMRVLGVKFPVYVLVTKCDLIQGVNRFCEKLPEESLKQPMGMINHNLSTDIAAFLESALQAVGKRLRNMRMLLLHQMEPRNVDPPLLLFPEEFDDIRNNLTAYIKALFGQNPYQETPLFRGLFFSSGRQEGRPHSHFMNNLGLNAQKESLPGTTRGLFLHDFFAKVLPKDRRLMAPTRKAMEWSAITSNLGLTAWIVVWVALCGLLSFSFVKNLHSISGISNEFQKLPVLQSEYVSDLTTLDTFRKGIIRIEKQNSSWWIPRFGLRESIHLEKELKSHYCGQFQERFLNEFDKRFIANARMIDATIADDEYAQYMAHAVRRVNILSGAPYGANVEKLSGKPHPQYIVMDPRDPANAPEIRRVVDSLLLYYFAWRQDPDNIKKEMAAFESVVKTLYDLRGGNLQWLITLANTEDGLEPATLKQFWEGTLTAAEEREVAPAYTMSGKRVIDAFKNELSSAHPGASGFATHVREFDDQYRTLSFDAWHHFAEAFPNGVERLKIPGELDAMALRVLGNESPHGQLIDRISEELSPIKGDGPSPDWFAQIERFHAIKSSSRAVIVYKTGFFQSLINSVKRTMMSFEKKTGQETGAKKLDIQVSAIRAFSDFQQALQGIAPVTTSRNIAFQMTQEAFADDPATSKSPFHSAYKAVQSLQQGVGDGVDPDPVVAHLVSGPFDILWLYARRQAVVQLENSWGEEVLAPTLGLSSQQVMPLLVGPDGLVWKFVKGSAAPFLNRNEQVGYYPKEVMGGAVPLSPAFYAFLNKGAKARTTAQLTQKNYTVGINGLPTAANPEARFQPHGTRLELQCGGSVQTLVNNNYPVSRTFYWSPDTCGDVVLNIEIGDVVLTKRYLGPQAFPDFLREFKGGSRIFAASEFPGERSDLDRLKVRYIKVAYRFIGNMPVVQVVETMPVALPRSIGK